MDQCAQGKIFTGVYKEFTGVDENLQVSMKNRHLSSGQSDHATMILYTVMFGHCFNLCGIVSTYTVAVNKSLRSVLWDGVNADVLTPFTSTCIYRFTFTFASS